MASTAFIDPRLGVQYGLGDDPSHRKILQDFAADTSAVAHLRLADRNFAKTYDQELFDDFIIPELFRYKAAYDNKPTTDTLKRFFRNNSTHYPLVENFMGSEIFIRDMPQPDDAAVSATVQRIQKRLANGENFNYVALQYNETIGVVSNGWLGRMGRGEVDDEKFNAFVDTETTRPFFGPVHLHDGYLFGKLNDKYTSDADAFDHHANRVLTDYRREWAKKKIRDFYTTQTELLEPKVQHYDTTSSSPEELIAYEVGPKRVTFAEARRRHPQYVGDASKAPFWEDIKEYSLKDDLILLSTASQEIKASPEYKFLAEAHKNAYLVFMFAEEQARNVQNNSKALQAFYDAHTSDTYAQSDLVRLLTFSLKRDVPAGQPIQPGLPSADFTAMTRVRELLAADHGEKAVRKIMETYPDMTCTSDALGAGCPLDSLGREFEIALDQIKPGQVPPVIVGDKYYSVALMLERTKRPPRPLSEIGPRVKSDFEDSVRNRVLSEIYGRPVNAFDR